MRATQQRLVRFLILFCIMCGAVVPEIARAQTSDIRIDLADAALSPIDLARIGLPGFTVDRAIWADWEESVSTVAGQLDVDDRDIEDSFDDRAGYLFGYDYELSVEPASGSDDVEVRSALLQFDSVNAASDAYSALADEVDEDLVSETIAGSWGDASSAYERDTSFVILFQQDVVLAQVSLETNYLEQGDFTPVLAGKTASLASTTERNLDDALSGVGAGFGATAVRFEVEGPDRIAGTDRYIVKAGQFIPQTAMDVTFVAFQDIQVDSFGMLTAYQRFLYPISFDDALVQLTIIQHSTEELAGSYVAFTRDRLDFGGGYQELLPFDDLQLPGDVAVAYSYTVTYTEEFVTEGIALVIQDGSITISMEIDGPDGVDPESVAAIAEMQLSCLSGDICETVPYPGDEENDRSTDLILGR